MANRRLVGHNAGPNNRLGLGLTLTSKFGLCLTFARKSTTETLPPPGEIEKLKKLK